jgi:hypothetical protein
MQAATFSFAGDPFEGSTAPTTPGRQVVGGERFITFALPSDVFALDPGSFGVTELSVINDEAANIPNQGFNVVVLRTFDNDADPTTPFGAGNAANLIADQIDVSAPGFFIYFNQGLDLPRLVFSTDLSDNTADLKILARMLNLNGQAGRDAMIDFTDANFQLVPEPSSLLLSLSGAALVFGYALRRKRNRT